MNSLSTLVKITVNDSFEKSGKLNITKILEKLKKEQPFTKWVALFSARGFEIQAEDSDSHTVFYITFDGKIDTRES